MDCKNIYDATEIQEIFSRYAHHADKEEYKGQRAPAMLCQPPVGAIHLTRKAKEGQAVGAGGCSAESNEAISLSEQKRNLTVL